MHSEELKESIRQLKLEYESISNINFSPTSMRFKVVFFSIGFFVLGDRIYHRRKQLIKNF